MCKRFYLFLSGKIIKLNYEINETLKTYNDILENPILIKSVNQENEENLFDFNVPSLSPGTFYIIYSILHGQFNIYIFP